MQVLEDFETNEVAGGLTAYQACVINAGVTGMGVGALGMGAITGGSGLGLGAVVGGLAGLGLGLKYCPE